MIVGYKILLNNYKASSLLQAYRCLTIYYGLNKRVFMPYVNIAGVDALQDQFMKLNVSPFITISYFSQPLRKPFRWNCQLVSTEFNKQYQRFSELGFQEFIHELIDKKNCQATIQNLFWCFIKAYP